jgi:hypothetical protein
VVLQHEVFVDLSLTLPESNPKEQKSSSMMGMQINVDQLAALPQHQPMKQRLPLASLSLNGSSDCTLQQCLQRFTANEIIEDVKCDK